MTAVVSNRDTTAAHATRLLEALGDTPEAVAVALAAAGIRGERCNEGACPIAIYLKRSDVAFYDVAVSGNIATLHFSDETWCYVDVPDAVEEFIDRFDQGGYPELVAGGAR